MALLNSARLIVLTLWLGAAISFSIVVAPATFSVVRSFELSNASEIAGSIVTRTLSVINVAGFVLSILLLLTLVTRRSSTNNRVSLLLELICLVTIAITTGVGHWLIAARMRALRVAMQLPIDQVPLSDPRRIAFQSLHGYSVSALGLAMIAALLAILLQVRIPRS